MNSELLNSNSIVILVFAGYFIGIFTHNFILYSYTYTKNYLFFSLYSLALFSAVVAISDEMEAMGNTTDLIPFAYEAIIFQLYLLALILFTLHINQTLHYSPKLYRRSIKISVLIIIGLGAWFFGNEALAITSIFAISGFILSIWITITALRDHAVMSKLYMLSLFPLFVVIFFHILALNSLLGSYHDLSQIVVFAAIWNMSTLALLISQNIKVIQKTKEKALLQNSLDANTIYMQSRNASMGEMVANIAHQWKQPLNAIGSIQNEVHATLILKGEISKEKLLDSITLSFNLLRHLSDTIDTFYGFLAQKYSTQVGFSISEEFEKIRKLTSYALSNSAINLEISLDINPVLKGDGNELLHALLNLVLNAKDALEEKRPPFPKISIQLREDENQCIITISDNAGGIKLNPPEQIFERYITTKSDGSGLGLYMTKEIIESRFGGSISVKNSDMGACFTIILPHDGYHETITKISNDLTDEKIKSLTHKILELEEAKEQLTKWSKIFHNAHWGIAIHIGTNSNFELTNPAFNALYGYSAREIKQLHIRDLFSEESLDVLSEASSHAFETGHTTFEALHRRKDGSIFPAMIELIIIKNDEGEVLYHIANIWDKTEEYKNMDHIRMLGKALDSTNEAVYLIDTEAQLIYVNDGASKMLGYSREELLTMSIMDLDPHFTLEDYKIKQKNLKHNFMQHGSNYMIMESVQITKDGKQIPIEVSSNLFYIGQALYTISTVRNISEQKEYAKQLKLITTAINTTGEAVYVNDETLSIIYVNESACTMLGYTREELLSMRIDQLDALHSLDEILDIKQILTENNSVIFETQHRTKTGEIIDVEIVGNMFEFEGKKLGLSIVKDITERKQAQEQLKNSEEMYRTLVENSNDNIIRYDNIGRIIYVNQKLLTFMGMKHEQMVGKTTTESNINFQEYETVLHKVLETGENVSYYFSFLDDNALQHHHHIQFVAERNTSGDIIGALAIGRDISEITNEKETLKHINTILEDQVAVRTKEISDVLEFNKNIIDSIPDPVFVKDDKHLWVIVNSAFCKFIGVERELLIGKSDYDFFTTQEADIFWEKDNEVLKTGKLNINEENFTGSDGITRIIQTIKIAFISVDNKKFLVGTIRDITERKTMENDLRQALEFNEGIIGAIPDLLFEISSDGIYLGIWTQDETLLVSQRAFLIGKNYQDVLPPHVCDVAKKTMKEVDEYGYSLGNTYELDLPEGKRWFELSVTKKQISGNYIILSRDITPRKKAEETILELNNTLEMKVKERTRELTEALAFNEGIIHALPDLLFELDRHGKYLNVWANNPEQFAAQKESLINHTVNEILSPEAASTVMEAIEIAATEGLSFGKIIEIELSDGVHWFELSVSKKSLEETFLLISRDISTRIESEKSLHKSEAMFRAIVENSPDVISRYDLEMHRIYVNPLMHFLLGKPLEEIIGKTPREYSPLPNIDLFEEHFRAVVLGKNEVEYECTYRTTWNEIRWGSQRIIPELDTHGDIVGVMVVGRDVTYQKQMELTLQQTVLQLSALLDTIPDLIWMKDPDGVYLICNHAFEKFFGASEATIIGKTDYDFVDQKLADFFRKKDLEAIEKKQTSINIEEVIYQSTGEKVLLETRKSPVYASDGKLIGVLGIGKKIH